MRILFLTQWFHPEPSFKGLPFAKGLMELGHKVNVITGFPNYPEGEIYTGYKVRPLQFESFDGVPVLRVPLYPSHNKSSFNRIANYISFSLSSSLAGSMLPKSFDIMYVYHPPATVGLSSCFIGFFRQLPFIYDINDLWPDSLFATGMVKSHFALNLAKSLCSFIYKQASKIIVVSPGFKSMLISRGVPETKIEMIYNWCDEKHFKNAKPDEKLKEELGLNKTFNIIFAGNMGPAQGLDTVIDSAAKINKLNLNVKFIFVGAGISLEKLRNKANKLKLQNVIFIPRVPISEIGSILSLANVLLIHLKDNPLFKITIPSKIQSYLAIGKPILAGVDGDSKKLVEDAKAGLSCLPGNSDDMVNKIIEMYSLPKIKLNQMGENGKRYYFNKMSFSKGIHRFEQIFKSSMKAKKIIW